MVSFKNSTSEQVIINYWTDRRMSYFFVEPGSTINVDNCTVGEWIILTKEYQRIGKFSDEPCASGNYSWAEYNDVSLAYDATTKICTLTNF